MQPCLKKTKMMVFFCFFSGLAEAAVQVQVEPTQINTHESFRLIITQNRLQAGIPELTPLQKDFMILGTERRMNYSIMNGHTQSSSEWIVTLKARKEGKLIIPAIKMGTELTPTRTIEVRTRSISQTTSSNTLNQQHDLYLSTEVNASKPFINQQVIFKVILYNSKNLLDADYQGPQVENALLIPLGEGKRYQTRKNNVDYRVEEQNYAIFPQKSGPLHIKSPVFTALIYDFNSERIIAKDKSINLNVQAIPKEYSIQAWLPAKKVSLTEHYDNLAQSMNQGDTLIRTVILEATGIPAQLLPKIPITSTEGVQVYPEKSEETNQVMQENLVGHTEIKVTYLVTQAGKVTIPELKIPWFNTETGKKEIAILSKKLIEVIPSTTPSASNPAQPPIIKKQNLIQAPEKQPSETASLALFNWAWIIAAFFAVAWLFTLGLWAWQKHTKKTGKDQYKAALDTLHEACMQGNDKAACTALLKWANLHWSDASLLNLTDLMNRTTHASFKKQVQILSQIRYKNQEKSIWQGDELWRSLQQIIKTNGIKKRTFSVLPPLNPG